MSQTQQICLITPSFPPAKGGVAQATARLARQLLQHQQLAYVVSPQAAHQDFSLPAELPVEAIQRAYAQRPWQLIHAYYPSLTGAQALKWAQVSQRPLIFSARGNDLDRDLWIPERRRKLLEWIPQAQQLTGVTRALTRQMQAIAPHLPCHYVPNAVDSRLFCPGSEPRHQAPLRHALGLGKNSLLLGFVGEARLKKGLPLLLRAFARLAQGFDVHLLFAGSIRQGADRELFELWQKQHLQLRARVHCLPEREAHELPEVYRALDIAVFPSYQEGMANAALEAMSCETAVLSSTVGGFPDMIADKKEGCLIAPFSEGALLEGLQALCASETLRRTLGQAARQRVLKEFQLHHEFGRLQQLYRSCPP